jgi:hypothetical protein
MGVYRRSHTRGSSDDGALCLRHPCHQDVLAFPSCTSRHPPPLPHAAPAVMALCLRHHRRQDLHSPAAPLDTHRRSHTRGFSDDGSLPSSPPSPSFAFPSSFSRHPPPLPLPHAAPAVMALCPRHHRRQDLHHLCISLSVLLCPSREGARGVSVMVSTGHWLKGGF